MCPMRYVELRRHTDNDGDKLSEQGVADAEAIGRTGLNPPYAAFISTGAERATEMLRILRRAAGQDEIPITTEAGMRSSVEDRWREAAKVAGKGASIEEMRAVDPDLVEHETQLLGSALQRVVQGLPEGGRALVVGHSRQTRRPSPGWLGRRSPPSAKVKECWLSKTAVDTRCARFSDHRSPPRAIATWCSTSSINIIGPPAPRASSARQW